MHITVMASNQTLGTNQYFGQRTGMAGMNYEDILHIFTFYTTDADVLMSSGKYYAVRRCHGNKKVVTYL